MRPFTSYKKVHEVIAAFGFFLLLSHSSLAQTAGQVMFVGFNADGNDGFAFVTLVPLPTGTTIYFTDDNWDGVSAFNTNEGAITWTNDTGNTISAGTVIAINDINGTLTLIPDLGSATESEPGFNLAGSDETLYMFLGSNDNTPTTFLSAIANDNFGSAPGIANTGLTSGVNAFEITGPSDEDVMVYDGPVVFSSVSAGGLLLTTQGNWSSDDSGGNDSNDGGYPDFPTHVSSNFYGFFEGVTYYSRNATSGGDWNDPDSWTTASDGSGGPLAPGIWPGSADNVVILSGHTITITDVANNQAPGISPDGLNRGNVGSFTGSGNTMFYHTGNIVVEGTLNADVAVMLEGYTLVDDGGSFSVDDDIVNLGSLEVSSGATFENIDDDLILSGNSITIINNTAGIDDDIYLDWTNATLCGTGVADIDGTVQFSNGATDAQICSTFTIICDAGCGTSPSGTFISGYTGPGGVGDAVSNQLWVRADDLTLNDGDPVTTWSDISGNGLSAVQGTAANQPTFQANDVNTVLPSLSFDGGDYLNLGNTALDFVPQVDEFSFFIAFNVASGGQGTFLSKAQSTAGNRQYQYTTDGPPSVFFTSFMGGSYNQGGDNVANAWTVGSAITTTANFNNYVNGVNDVSGGGVGTATLPGVDVLIGARRNNDNTDAGFQLTGRIAEIAVYSSDVNLAQRIIVENYLAAKYDVTLNANDVYDMDNGGNGDYDFEVAGIGQASDGSNHRDAKGSGIVRIWNPSGLGNSEFLIWGHDNGAVAGTTTDVDGVLIEERLERVWRVAETGDVGTISISIDLDLPINDPTGSELRLLIDRDGDGFSDNDVTPIAGAYSVSGDQIIFSGINFQDGDRFTLGNADILNPLPIELISFQAQPESSLVRLSWSTASEINNDYFTIERSKTTTDWEVVVNVRGAGTSSQPINYTAVDDGPYPGTSYYRLKQTDYDGNFSYSKIERVVIQFEDKIVAYPNPAGESFTISAPFKLSGSQIEMLDHLGRAVPVKITLRESGTAVDVDSNLLPPGSYILRVTDNFVVRSMHLVIYR